MFAKEILSGSFEHKYLLNYFFLFPSVKIILGQAINEFPVNLSLFSSGYNAVTKAILIFNHKVTRCGKALGKVQH